MAATEEVIYKIELQGAPQVRQAANEVSSSFDQMHSRYQQLLAEGAARNQAEMAATPGVAGRGGVMGMWDNLGGKAGIGKVLGVLGVAGVGYQAGQFVRRQFMAGIRSIGEHQAAEAQIGAAIKSTGNAAHVSLPKLVAWSLAMGKLTGINDVAIEKSQSVLLGFTSIRNSLGKGNDLFNQADTAVLNLSTRLGHDMNAAAIQVGRALQDPIKGVTALTRAGVTFSASQKEQIKGFEETGHHAEAQKLILGQLNTQFKGAAVAYGKTWPGAVGRFGVAWAEMRDKAIKPLMPYLTRLLLWTADHMPAAFRVLSIWIDQIKSVFSLWRREILLWWSVAEPLLRFDIRLAKSLYGIGQAMVAAGPRLWKGAKDMVKGIVNAFVDGFNWIIKMWNNFDFSIDTGIPGIGTVGVGTPNMATIGRWGGFDSPASRSGPHATSGLGGFGKPNQNLNPLNLPGRGNNPVILVADGKQIATVVAKGDQKRAHARGLVPNAGGAW